MGLFGRHDDEISSSTLEEEESQGGFSLDFNLSPELQIGIAFGVTLLIGFVCAMAVLPALRPEPAPIESQAAGPQADFSDPTAREAYVPAVELIRQTDPGAILASGGGAWTPDINTTQLDAGRTGWTFFFYLPDYQEMAQVVVDKGGTAHLAERQAWETPPDVIDDQRWTVDSPAAVVKLVESCSEVLDAEPDAGVHARLSMASENRTILWQMSVQSEANPLSACEVNVDAITGVIR
jgi:hypothetical protein